jgi:hypothetical protein
MKGATIAHVGGARPFRVISGPTTALAGGGRLGMMAGMARGGPIALAVAAILGIPMILNGIRKNTEKSANNSTKSVASRNQMISATVLQHGNG